ncbi:MAG TPA: RNA-binding cell elongation regulator Jag/EloR [Gaiellaceae bacterium]|nr:RNA-binding cell elongation regulator Jag/EloR [Gaiellaceae bacterium]
MSDTGAEALSVEAAGETVGEAKWKALRELERRAPGLDRASVRFQVVSEGERGLLGVGYTPARVVATAAVAEAPVADEPGAGTELERRVQAIAERVVGAIGAGARVTVSERDDEVLVSCSGGDLGLLIGRRGQTIDALQQVLNAAVWRAGDRKPVTVDAAGYRERRRAALETLAVQAAERAARGERVALDPMTPAERRVVHERLKEEPGVRTSSSGSEPNRYVVVEPDA